MARQTRSDLFPVRRQVLYKIWQEKASRRELTMVDKALHPESEDQDSTASKGQGLMDNRTIDDNIAYTPNTVKWTKISQGVRAKGLPRIVAVNKANKMTSSVRSLLNSVSVATSQRQNTAQVSGR